MQIMEGDLIRNLNENIEYISHFHTAGNPGRQDLDNEQEIYYPPIMKAIAATDYQGYVGHEYRPKGDPIASLEHAFSDTHHTVTAVGFECWTNRKISKNNLLECAFVWNAF